MAMEAYAKATKKRARMVVNGGIFTIIMFFLFSYFNVVQAATTVFTQGGGYQVGKYQTYADQPTALNWNRLSRFAATNLPAVKWTKTTGGAVTASPVIGSDGTIYIGSGDTYLYAYKADGSLKWKFKTLDSIQTAAAIGSDGTIYVTSGTTLYAISSAGKAKWTYTIPTEANSSLWLQASPAIDKSGIIYVGVSGFFKSGDTTIAKGSLLAISNTGTLKWKFNTSSIDATPAIAKDGTIYVTDVHYASQGNYVDISGHVYAVYPTGKQKWKYEIGSYTPSSVTIGSAGTVYAGSEDDYFYSINPSNGLVKWKVKVAGDITGTAAIDSNGIIYVGTHSGRLYAMDPNGKIKWQFKATGAIQSSPIIDKNGVIYFGSDDNYVYAVNPGGSLKWKANTDNKVKSSPAISEKGNIYVGSEDGKLYNFNAAGKSTFVFTGKVLDKTTKKPIANANVLIGGKKVQTKADGSFSISGIPQSKYVLNIYKTGYHTYVDNYYSLWSNATNRTFYLETGGALTIAPTTGVPHTTVKVSGKGLPISDSGELFLDKNKNKLLDPGEDYVWVYTNNLGEFSNASLVIPEMTAGKYELIYTSKIVEQDPYSIKQGTFTLNPLKVTITSNISTGEPHVTAFISGSGFAPGERGTFYFDKNKNGKYEYTESSQWVSMTNGSFTKIPIFIPNTSVGDYQIRYVSDLGTLTVPAVKFTVKKTTAQITLSTVSGPALTKVVVKGASFVPNISGTVFFDKNKNNKLDYSIEPSAYVTADSTGKFTSSGMYVPNTAVGDYKILFVPSRDTLTLPPAVFTVTKTTAKMALSPIKGSPHTKINVSGSLFPPEISGTVYFDLNKNGKLEYSEPNTFVTTGTDGTFKNAQLTAPSAAAGTYQIRFVGSTGSISVPSVTFTLEKSKAALTASVASPLPHQTIAVSGTGFIPGDSGVVYVDINNNGVRDWDVEGEDIEAYVTVNSVGAFKVLDFGIPDVKTAGVYNIRFESDTGPLEVAPAKVTIAPTPAAMKAATSVNRNGIFVVTGEKFPVDESGVVYIDIDGDEYSGWNEPSGYVTADANGGFQVSIAIPSDAPVGTYLIRFDSYSSYGPLNVKPLTITIK
jgi:outer membrane protein assembly factor BamB